MRLFVLLALFGAISVKANILETENDFIRFGSDKNQFLINALISRMIHEIKSVIRNGSSKLNLPVMDPWVVNKYHMIIPAGIINADVYVENAMTVGLGNLDFTRWHLNVTERSFDAEILIPKLTISAEHYNMTGDMYTVLPLYGKGSTKFELEDFVMRGKWFFKQSENEVSLILDRIENSLFDVPLLRSFLTGVIGGGVIDDVVNAIIEEVFVDYINRFNSAIGKLTASGIVLMLNPYLEQMDTWKYFESINP